MLAIDLIQDFHHGLLERARRQGKKLGRPRVTKALTKLPKGLTVRQAAKPWGVSKSTAARWVNKGIVPKMVGQTLLAKA